MVASSRALRLLISSTMSERMAVMRGSLFFLWRRATHIQLFKTALRLTGILHSPQQESEAAALFSQSAVGAGNLLADVRPPHAISAARASVRRDRERPACRTRRAAPRCRPLSPPPPPSPSPTPPVAATTPPGPPP